jgi:hypothetical protein
MFSRGWVYVFAQAEVFAVGLSPGIGVRQALSPVGILTRVHQ